MTEIEKIIEELTKFRDERDLAKEVIMEIFYSKPIITRRATKEDMEQEKIIIN